MSCPGGAGDLAVSTIMTHEYQLASPAGQRLLAELRRICAPLPEVEEITDGFGHRTFKVGKKSFVIAGMGEQGDAVSIKCDPATQDHLVRRGPYYRTPYIGQHGWISIVEPFVRNSAADGEEVAELIVEAYRRVAPKRLLKRLAP